MPLNNPAPIENVEADLTAVMAVTDLIPDAGAMTSIAQEATLVNAQVDITAIEAVTSALPDAGALTSIAQDATVALDATVAKEATLTDVQEEVEETEQHFHNIRRAAGLRVPQTATEWADFATLAPYVLTSGANVWGAWVQIFGTDDTPVLAGKTHFDPQTIEFVEGSDNTPYRVQFAYGATTPGDALMANQYDEFVVTPTSVPGPIASGAPMDGKMLRLTAGMQMWMRCWNAGVETLDLFIHIHEYPAGP